MCYFGALVNYFFEDWAASRRSSLFSTQCELKTLGQYEVAQALHVLMCRLTVLTWERFLDDEKTLGK